MKRKNKLVWGWGVNDVNYPITKSKVVDGKSKQCWMCPYYSKWRSILGRCFSDALKNKYLNYKDCTICEDWKYLSNFIKWVDSQPNKDWINCDADKDLLIEGNKHYSPDAVVFVPSKINTFVTDGGKSRGKSMLGVRCIYHKSKKSPYEAQCCNPFSGKVEYLGVFVTELEAHKAWQSKKHEHALKLADTQNDPRLADALRQRYAPDKDWSKR